MSYNTNPVVVPCKNCDKGVVIVEVPNTGSGGTKASSPCPKCHKTSSYHYDLNAGKLTRIY